MYAYARTRSIIKEVTPPKDAKVDVSLLTHKTERSLLTLMHKFWHVVAAAYAKHSPSTLCEYVFDLAKAYSAWYENVSAKNAETGDLMATRVEFVKAFGALLKKGLSLLGISTIERM